MPNISVTFVDGIELAKKNKEIERMAAAEMRMRHSISTLALKKARLLKDIATLDVHRRGLRHHSLAGDLC